VLSLCRLDLTISTLVPTYPTLTLADLRNNMMDAFITQALGSRLDTLHQVEFRV
jgi:uncharacterized protein (DUF433 family)